MAAGATYEPIATTTLGSAQATITFSSIPATYTDLRLVLVPSGSTSSGWQYWFRVNSDTATNYSWTNLFGTGSTASSARNTSQTRIEFASGWATTSASTPHMFTVDIFSYANTSTNKTMLFTSETDENGSGRVGTTVGLWRSTSAINSVTFALESTGTYGTGTTATLYGIKSA